MHECPNCDAVCYCDLEDVRFELDDDCVHRCAPVTSDDDDYDYDEETLNEELQ